MRSLFVLMVLVCGLQAKSFAVVVGIDNSLTKSSSFKKLTGAVNDAKVFKRLLEQGGVESQNIIYLHNERATKYAIKDALQKIEQKIVAGRGDKFYYFHAGHGARGEFIGGDLADIKHTAILLPYDFTEKDPNSYIVTRDDLLPLFRKIDEKVSFGMLVFDTCYSGFAYKGLGDMREADRYQSRYYSKPIEIDANKYNPTNTNTSYPYKHIISLASSSEDQQSKEDKKAKRGVFSMALESCLKSTRFTTKMSLKNCLDRRYTKQLYVFKIPKLMPKNSTLFNLKKDPIERYKITIQSDIDPKILSALTPLANFSKQSSPKQMLELSRIKGSYLLRELPDGVTIGKFANVDKLKRYLSNYRLIALEGSKSSNIDVKISYPNAKEKDNDIVPTNSSISITINSTQEGYLAIFSLDKEGKLYMIEPYYNYHKFRDGMVIGADSSSQGGTDFLKVIIFRDKNSLEKMKVVESTGKLLEDDKQIEAILNECKGQKFVTTTRKIITAREVK